MDRILNLSELAKELYGEATKSNRTTLARMCADGRIKNCEKHGKRWFVNATREYPHLFGEVSPHSVHEVPKLPEQPGQRIGADTTVADLVAMMVQAAS